MTAAKLHSALFMGRLRTECISNWARITNKSCTFLKRMMVEAEENGVDKDQLMQYAIAQTPGHRGYRGGEVKHRKVVKEDEALCRKQNLTERFLYKNAPPKVEQA